jgi:hypothetical protein
MVRSLVTMLPHISTPNTASRKYSTALNCRAILDNWGAMSARASTPIRVPIMDADLVTFIASAALPRLANRFPSMAVAAAEAVPGMFSRMAEMEPPYMPPT